MLPAQAGVILEGILLLMVCFNAPRAGGGDPEVSIGKDGTFKCSPRRRG